MNPVFRVSLAASESLKSNILRRVREEEKQLSPEKMNARSSGCSRFGIRRQNQRTTSQQNGTRKLCGRSRSLRSSSRTQMKETCQGSNSETISESNSKSKTKPKGTSRARAGSGRARARGRGQGRPPSQIWVKEEASQNSSFLDTSGNSSVAKPRPGPIKRRLRSSTSLVPALSTKVRRLEDDSNREKTAPSSPSSSSTNRNNPWMVPESPCGLVIEERKSPGHRRKISISESAAKEFCSSIGDTSCGIVCSTKSGRKKKYKVCLTKRLHDSCPATETLSKKMQPRSNLTRNKVSKQKKKENDSDGRATRRHSKDKDENIGPMVNAQRTDDHLNHLLQDSGKSNPAGALKSVISQTSPGTSRKKHDGLVRELIHRRINETLAAQNGLKEDIKPTTTQNTNTVVSSGMLLTNKQQSIPTAEQNPSQSDAEATTNSMTVTETAAVEAAKAVGGISLMPLHKAKNPDFLPTVSSPCTPTMTVMKASSDQTVSSTMSFESNLKGPKSKVLSDPETRQLPSSQSGTSSVLQPLAQCKCVDSVSTVPTPSLIEIGNIQAAQPIFLTPESFQFQPISYPGMAALNLVDPTTCLPELSKQKKKRNSKKKSVEKKSPSAVPSENTLSSVAVSSASSSLDPDTKDPDIKDPSLDDKGEKIKRPMNAFMIWSREQRAILALQTPRMTNADISVKLGIMWNDLDYSEKQKYFDEAIKLKLQHRQDYPDWVYQPRPHQRPSRRKRQPLPFCEEGRQQVPCSQMLLILPDGQQVICPAIPQQACQGAAPVVNTVAPAPVDIKDAKKISQPKEQATDAVMTNSASSQPVGAKDVKSSEDENKSTTQQSEQAKSKMLVIMPKGKQVECQVVPHQNGQTANPVTTNTVNSVTPKPSLDVKDVNLVSEQSTQPKSKLLLVMPDGKQVLCPEISKPEIDVKVVKKSVNQPGELSKSSEEKLLVVKSEKCEKCEDKKSTVALKSQSGLPAATAINLGPVIKLTKDMKNSNTETNISEGKLSSSAQSTKQQETTHEEKKGVPPLEMAVTKNQSETSQGATESAAATEPVMVQSDVQKVTEMKAIDKSDVTPVPVAIHVSAIAQVQTSEVGKNKSIAKSSDHLQPQLSNADQQSPLTEMISLQVAPVSSQTPQQDCALPKVTVNALEEMIISSRPHSADDSSLPQRQTIPNNDASQFQTGNFSQTHPAVRLYPLDFHQSVVPLQPMNKDTGIQTLHDWSSCTSNNQTNQTLPTNLPSSVLKNQPINMVWQSDSRILQPVNISDKGTSTSYPFYFTPIQQVQGVQETSNAPPMGSMMAFPAVPATADHCTAPVPTATLTDSGPSDAAMSATQFANIPTLCEISEPERLLESLAMTAVEISEDEAEETENLFQRVMDMVPN